MGRSRKTDPESLSIERRLESVQEWLQTQAMMDKIIEAGQKEPERLRPAVLSQITNSINHSLNMLSLAEALIVAGTESGVEIPLDLDEMMAQLQWRWSAMRDISRNLIERIESDPLSASSQDLASLTTVSRRSLDILKLIERKEQQKEEEERSQTLSPEQEQMLAEFEELEADFDDEFNMEGDWNDSEESTDQEGDDGA